MFIEEGSTLTASNQVILGNIISAQMFNSVLCLCGTCNFISIFTVGCFWYSSEPDESILNPRNPVLLTAVFPLPYPTPLYACVFPLLFSANIFLDVFILCFAFYMQNPPYKSLWKPPHSVYH